MDTVLARTLALLGGIGGALYGAYIGYGLSGIGGAIVALLVGAFSGAAAGAIVAAPIESAWDEHGPSGFLGLFLLAVAAAVTAGLIYLLWGVRI